ncbi:MAG: phosphoribosyl-ATP diphosphatase [Treponema sp.]|nr:phosphoribosyl-ATP diphosphatase [Treponema sp.]
MVIASIDIQDMKAVQLKQGTERVLERDDPIELATDFDQYGEIAVIDLDAAMGKWNNEELIAPILRQAECRVGGGIKTVEQAHKWVSLGAKKIIVGSKAFRNSDNQEDFQLNAEFLEALARKIGRERLIAAVDARNGEILVDGWKTPTGLSLIETAKAAEPFVSELLFTCVEREGTMTGIDLDQVKTLREAVSCAVTVAGGVSTLAEIESIAALGCNVQLGMALYTGKISLAEGFIKSLNWKKGQIFNNKPLLPVIAQSEDGQVLMTGFTDSEALAETFKRGNLCFYSRTRNTLWMKGETSGNTLKLRRIRSDCDHDAILATVESPGPVCHTGAYSCFNLDRRYTLEFLQAIITDRLRNPTPGSYTAALDDELVRRKVMEEAYEVCTAKARNEIIWEAADLLFFTTALITKAGITVREVFDELDRRHKK